MLCSVYCIVHAATLSYVVIRCLLTSDMGGGGGVMCLLTSDKGGGGGV